MILHITPRNDKRKHTNKIYQTKGGINKCRCLCEPKIEFVEETGNILVTHNSFDGREAVEWFNEILNNE